MKSTTRIEVLWLLVLGAGCGASNPGALRFENHDPIWSVDDRRPTDQPAARPPGGFREDTDSIARRPVVLALELPKRPHALNVNSFDEVPDSSWFENRIGVRELSPAELARNRSPDPKLPFQVHEVTPTRSSVRLIA